jgi:hypothetical protein
MPPWQDTEHVINYLHRLQPKSILDVGAGLGRWGVLCRCHVGDNVSLASRPDHELKIDAIEGYKGNINPIYEAVYNHTYADNASQVLPTLGKYDVIICSHMIEHLEKGEAWRLIDEMISHSIMAVVITLPFGHDPRGPLDGNPLEAHLSTWYPEDFDGKKCYVWSFAFFRGVDAGVVILPRSDLAKWQVKMLRNPFRLFVANRFPALYGAVRAMFLHR